MEKWGLGPEDVHARNPGAIYARVSGYGQTGPLPRPPGLRVRGRGDLRPAPHQRLPGPGAAALAASRLGDTLAAQSAFQGILLALYARAATAPRARSWTRAIVDACFAMSESTHARVREDRLRPRADRPAAPAHRAEQRLLLQGRQVGRDRRQPRHAVAAAGEDHGPARSWARTSASPPTTRAASTRTCSTRSSARSRREHTAEELDEIVNGGGVVCAPVYTAEDVYEDPYFRERELLVETEDEVHGRGDRARGRAEAEPDARLDPSGRPLDRGRRHGRSAGGARGGRGRSASASRTTA